MYAPDQKVNRLLAQDQQSYTSSAGIDRRLGHRAQLCLKIVWTHFSGGVASDGMDSGHLFQASLFSTISEVTGYPFALSHVSPPGLG